MINHFTFNGTSTADLGLIVSGVSIFGAGSRKVEKAGIPGRNGDLQIELGGFNNYTVRYTVSITNNFTATAQDIREWLLEAKGYCELTDTYHPDEIRKACYNSDIEFTTTSLYKYGQASIQFDCLPQRYIIRNTPITTGPNTTTTENTEMFLNTTKAPLRITLKGNSASSSAVTGSNEIIITGKNLLSKETYKYGTQLYIGNNDTGYDLRLPAGTYTISDSPNASVGLYCREKNDGVNTQLISNHTKPSTKTFTLNGGDYRFWFYSSVGVSNSDINYYQLERGSTATEYEEYVSQSFKIDLPVENLLHINNSPYTVAGVTFTETNKGVRVTGTPSETASCVLYEGVLPRGDYCVSGLGSGASNQSYQCVVYENGSTLYYVTTSSKTFTADGTSTYLVRLYVYPAYGNYNITLPCQLESGTTQNAYTPYGTTPVALGSSDTITTSNGKWYINSTQITYAPLIAQLEELKSATSYDEKTNILQKGNANPFVLNTVSLNAEKVASAYNGEPIIQANSTGYIVINGEVMEVLSAPVTINCQTMQCYNGSTNMNNEVRVDEFPQFKKGDNLVASDMELTITPNNWRH